MQRGALLALLVAQWAPTTSSDAASRQEEEVLQRMLMLQHRALFGDRPLPLSSEDSSAASEANAGAGTCSTGISDWEAQFASEQAEPQPQTPQAAAFAAHFPVVVRAFNDGAWDTAQDLLYQLCLAGQTTAQAYEVIARATSDGVGGAAGGAGAAGVAEETPWFGYAQRVTAWLQDCTTLVQYVPRQPPVRMPSPLFHLSRVRSRGSRLW